jgi:type I restriction enzyme, S subunit
LLIADLTRQRRVRRSLKAITEAGRASRHLELIPAGSLLYSMYASLGAVSMLEIDATVNQAIIGIKPHESKLNVEYGLYFLESLRPAVVQLSSSSTQANLNAEKVRSLPIFLPPLPEQAALVRYLDYMDRRIQRYIRAKQKIIKLLEEQKQAIIHQAVTGRIDVRTGKPYPAYKPSGVEWLGEVPEHWEVCRNGRLFVQRNETGFADLPVLEVSLRTGVRIRDLDSPERKQMMADRDKYKRARKGNIAYNMMRMWQGAIGVAPIDGLVSPAYVVATPLPGTEPRYFERLFCTSLYMGEVDKYSRGIVKDRNRLYWVDFKRMPACYPPPDEQVEIANTIDSASRQINLIYDQVHQEIKLLREYRTRLISDVVTGKLDVREAAVNLPEELEEELPADQEPEDEENEDLVDEEPAEDDP